MLRKVTAGSLKLLHFSKTSHSVVKAVGNVEIMSFQLQLPEAEETKAKETKAMMKSDLSKITECYV